MFQISNSTIETLLCVQPPAFSQENPELLQHEPYMNAIYESNQKESYLATFVL